jgi:hypothetical protein
MFMRLCQSRGERKFLPLKRAKSIRQELPDIGRRRTRNSDPFPVKLASKYFTVFSRPRFFP